MKLNVHIEHLVVDDLGAGPLRRDRLPDRSFAVAGTPAYMAPEMVAGDLASQLLMGIWRVELRGERRRIETQVAGERDQCVVV